MEKAKPDWGLARDAMRLGLMSVSQRYSKRNRRLFRRAQEIMIEKMREEKS
jgi:hypothetical protein